MSDNYGNAQAFREIESELGQSFTWGDSSYPCQIGARRESKDLGDGGFALASGLEIIVRQEVIGTPPAVKDVVTVGSRSLRVEAVTWAPDDAFVVLSCEDDTKGV